MDPLNSITSIAASGLRAQSARLQVVSENIANSESTALTPNEEPYRRKTVSFGSLEGFGEQIGLVAVTGIHQDASGFKLKFNPGHPAADKNGFVKMPNVNPILEMGNMREATRSYEANMNMFEAAQKMRTSLIDLLR